MKFQLKNFQSTSARSILTKLNQARAGVSGGDLEAIVLSAPTGSGKTITVAAVIDWTFCGTDGIPARPNTTFLWLSDSPELNQQSKDKLLAACDHVPFHRVVTVDSESFDEERLAPGHIYFINTQLLGKDKLLTKGGDKKTFTFWQTIANTIAAAPEDLVLIIDEAHRGAGVTERARKPIMQKFITGSDVDGLPAVPLVLGMSATPQRFTELLGNTARTQRPVNISSEMVRLSGLLKDLIVVTTNKSKTADSDLTHLQNAAARWKYFHDRWEKYCASEREKESVRPVFVVQVQDGAGKTLSATPLHDVVSVIQRVTGPLAVNEIVHCFQEKEELRLGGSIVRRMDASRIQGSPDVKVVLFKTALTTGWDCPRAEVMMSFRRSVDATTIAQLVGRMIRTPLARRIESDEVLNTVELFLPHYDTENLEAVLNALRSPDAHEGTPSDVTTKAIEYPRSPAFTEVFEHLAELPTYSVHRAPKMSDLKRALRLAGMLVQQGIDKEADDQLRGGLTTKIRELRDGYAKKIPKWDDVVREGGEIDVDVTAVAIGEMAVANRRTTRFALSDENIEQLFEESGRLIASGEGLHRTYWKRYSDREDSNKAKLELAAVVRQEDALPTLEKLAREKFDQLWKANKNEIKKLPPAEFSQFEQLIQASGRPEVEEWILPDCIVERPGTRIVGKHLFADQKGDFSTTLNSWEEEFLAEAMAREDFVCWLRNLPRRDWALTVPYDHAGEKPFFPDFIIVRRKGASFEVDILEPHDDTRTDTWAKVRGLAKFADKHHMDFGRLMVGRKRDGAIQIVDVSVDLVRQKALRMGAPADLEALFESA